MLIGFTKEEIVRGLETCTSGGHECTKCPYASWNGCRTMMEEDALSLIHQYEETMEATRRVMVSCAKELDAFGSWNTRYCP